MTQGIRPSVPTDSKTEILVSQPSKESDVSIAWSPSCKEKGSEAWYRGRLRADVFQHPQLEPKSGFLDGTVANNGISKLNNTRSLFPAGHSSDRNAQPHKAALVL